MTTLVLKYTVAYTTTPTLPDAAGSAHCQCTARWTLAERTEIALIGIHTSEVLTL
jgi:hypothetical protein